MTADAGSNQYALGHATGEIERLIEQGRFFGDLTERLFRDAGMRPAMRVLDIGCGMGDVSFLAASLVGPEGAVTGVDRSPEAIGYLACRGNGRRERAVYRGRHRKPDAPATRRRDRRAPRSDVPPGSNRRAPPPQDAGGRRRRARIPGV